MQTDLSLPTEMQLLNEHELASILKRKVSTLRADRLKGCGIKFLKLGGRHIRYRMSDVLAYLHAAERTSTSDTGEANHAA